MNISEQKKTEKKDRKKVYAKKYRLENPDYHKNYRLKNKENLKQYFKELNQKEERKIYNSEWRKKNADKIKLHNKRKYIKNKDKILERQRIKYQKNYRPIIINCIICGIEIQKKSNNKTCLKCKPAYRRKTSTVYFRNNSLYLNKKHWLNDRFLNSLIQSSFSQYIKSETNLWDKAFHNFQSVYKTSNDRINIQSRPRLDYNKRFNNLYNYVSKRLLKRSGKKYSTDKYNVMQEMYYSKIIATSHRVNNFDSLWEKKVKYISSSNYIQQ
jgi:hypothetical protein